MKVLVTGANGFVGRALCDKLLRHGQSVRGALRQSDGALTLVEGVEPVGVGTIDAATDWKAALAGCDAVVHLAARVHVMRDEAADPLAEFRKVNVEGTLNLARQAAAAGVRRFVFLSSVKVNGEGIPHRTMQPPRPSPLPPGERGEQNPPAPRATPKSPRPSGDPLCQGGGGFSEGDAPAPCATPKSPRPSGDPLCQGGGGFCEDDAPAPQDAYAVSKWEAEQGLMAIARETGIEVVILRPPLVYGPGVGANFLRLMRLVERGMPLPFGAVDNRRSLLYLGNLVDAIALCLAHPAAANQTYLVSDGEDVSTPELIRLLAARMGRQGRLLRVPTALMELGGKLVGRGAEVQRLLGSLVVDSGKIRRELGWRPPYTLDEGLAETVRWYRGR